jgi:M penetrans paralogue family 26
MTDRQMLPNATAVLVLGICSIVCSCFFVGLILGIIGLVISSKPRKMYKETPDLYDGYASLNAGYIMSIIGTALGGLYVVYVIIWVVILGSASMLGFHHNYY